MPRRSDDDLFTAAPLPVARLTDAERLACLRLIRSENVGPVTFRALINQFGGATQALAALPEIARRAGRQRPIRIWPEREAIAELAAARRAGIQPLFTIEPGYPAALAAADVPPPLVYVKGDEAFLNRPTVAIVGSRQASAAGVTLTRQIAAGIGRAGLVVASGLARGIDAAAHEATLTTGTVAVLAGGVDVVYPPEHERLHAAIAEAGCLVSEMPPGFVPRGKDFPRRNRIISGISLGVLVIEAARRSGSLITARMAGEQGREVLAVPGHPLDPRAEGTNDLLRKGATFVTSAGDVVEALAPMIGAGHLQRAPTAENLPVPAPVAASAPPPASPALASDSERALVFSALGPAPVAVDALARATGLSARAVQAALLELTISGAVEHHGSQLVSRR
ncbi:MAG: DNA-processing protein DprA [Hyphomicrobiaceae bacterium]